MSFATAQNIQWEPTGSSGPSGPGAVTPPTTRHTLIRNENDPLPHCPFFFWRQASVIAHWVVSKYCLFSRGRRSRFGADPSTSRPLPRRRRRRRRRCDISTTDGTGWTRCGPGTSTRRRSTQNPPTVSFTSRTTSTTRTRDALHFQAAISILTNPIPMIVTLIGCANTFSGCYADR